MFKLYVNKNKLIVREREPITSGSVNACRARFEFSPDWEGLTRKAVFKGSGVQASVLLDESGECPIPWEVLTKYGGLLMAGVCGATDETTLPTVWATLGPILEGVTADGELSRPPAPEPWEQELARKGDRLDYTPDGELGLYSGDDLLNAVPATGGGSIGEVYSTEETRIGTWIDGKPIYRRTFKVTSPSAASGGSVEVLHVEIPVDTMVDIYGSIMTKTGQFCPLPYYSSSEEMTYIAYNGHDHVTYPNSLRIMCGENNVNTPVVIILEYTKTTDQAAEA